MLVTPLSFNPKHVIDVFEKVDLDQTLSGVDRLLKSQELTFAFVGVSPSLAVVYVTFGYVGSVWRGGRGKKRYGGRQRREGTWRAIRPIEEQS